LDTRIEKAGEKFLLVLMFKSGVKKQFRIGTVQKTLPFLNFQDENTDEYWERKTLEMKRCMGVS